MSHTIEEEPPPLPPEEEDCGLVAMKACTLPTSSMMVMMASPAFCCLVRVNRYPPLVVPEKATDTMSGSLDCTVGKRGLLVVTLN